MTSIPGVPLPSRTASSSWSLKAARAFAKQLLARAVVLRESGQWSCSWPHAANDRWCLDHRDRHDVEDAAGVGVFRIGQFLVAPALVVGGLNLAVDLAAIRAFEIDAVLPVGGDGAANGRVGGLLLRDLLDVERFLVGDVELGCESRRSCPGRKPSSGGGPAPFLPLPGLSFTGPPLRHLRPDTRRRP